MTIVKPVARGFAARPALHVPATDEYVGSAWSSIMQVLVVTSFLAMLLGFHNLFARYAQRFARRGDTRIPPSPTAKVIGPDYEVTPEMVAEFKELAKKEPIKWDEAAWTKDIEFIKAMIRREIDVDLFGMATAYLNLAKRDPQLQFAITQFGEAQQLLDMSRQSTSRRASR